MARDSQLRHGNADNQLPEMKTQKEIVAELSLLRKYAPRIPQRSAFGDDNRAKIDASIEALEERMDVNEVYEREDSVWDSDQVGAAREAIEWRDDDGDSVSSGWECLVK